MTDFAHFSIDEREEWLRNPVTVAALAELRELHQTTADGALAAAETPGTTTDEIRLGAGQALGMKRAIQHLTRIPK